MAIPGLKVVVPSTPSDMIGLFAAAVRDADPVIVVEPKVLYASKGEVADGEIVDELGTARVLREGSDVTIAALGAMVLSLGVWRRPRSWEIRSGGIQLVLGGPLFGDRQLIPWGSITHFGGRRTGPDEVCLSFRQQHVASVQTLPGQALTVEEYDRLIDRLRIVIGKRFPQLDLGALE